MTLKGTGFEVIQTWVQTPALPFPRCVILRSLFTTLSFRFSWKSRITAPAVEL